MDGPNKLDYAKKAFLWQNTSFVEHSKVTKKIEVLFALFCGIWEVK